jgi:hypothetical protein
MDPKSAYIQVAFRYMNGAQVTLRDHLSEVSGFCSYHAFESIGGAVCFVRNRAYSQRSHTKKINQFMSASHAFAFSHSVSRVAILLASVRNECLYPEYLPDGSMELPEQKLSVTDASILFQRVGGVISSITKQI